MSGNYTSETSQRLGILALERGEDVKPQIDTSSFSHPVTQTYLHTVSIQSSAVTTPTVYSRYSTHVSHLSRPPDN